MTHAPDTPDRSDAEDPRLDALLTSHLNAALAGQSGRAAAAFQRQIDAETHAREVRRTRRAWMWASIPAALAACFAVVAMVGNGGGVGPIPPVIAGKPPVGSPRQAMLNSQVDSATYYRDLDDGIRVLEVAGGQRHPVRQIVRQVVRQTQWYDPEEKATMQVTVPTEEVMHVRIQPY